MLLYATEADLTGWTQLDAPDNAASLLRSASLLVADATRADVYATDPAGVPTDTRVAEALRDATCAQVAAWAALGLDPAAGSAGARAVVSSSGIGGASVDYETGATGQTLAAAAHTLTGEAALILRGVGLMSGRPFLARG